MGKKPYGLTGGLGCGKSTVAKLLRKCGAMVFDCDKIAKDVMTDPAHQQKIKDILHSGIVFFSDGTLNTVAIEGIIFFNPGRKKALEQYVHPYVWERISSEMKLLYKDVVVFIESAILFESGWADGRFEKIIVVTCSEAEQRRRLNEYRKMPAKAMTVRIANQVSLKEKESRADVVITNDGSLEHLELKVRKLCEALKTEKGAKK